MQAVKNNSTPFSDLFAKSTDIAPDLQIEPKNISTQISGSSGQKGGEAMESFHDHHGLAEVSLLRAVILQAIVDTMSNSKRTEEKVAKSDASNWFDIKNKDFQFICELSGWSPDWVLESTKKALEKPEKWRRNHGRYGAISDSGLNK